MTYDTEPLTTRIKTCTCIHKAQDLLYGHSRRVHNQTADNQWRCTVCGVKKP